MTTIVRRVLLACAIGACSTRPLLAHAIHTTLTVAQIEGAVLTLTVRSFADDFSLSVARHAGRAAPRDSSVRADEVARYLRDRLSVRDAAGRVLVLAPCGIRRVGELYFTCVRAVLPQGVRGVQLRNAMLTELHADQVNIVQVDQRGARRTLLFTRASAPSRISPDA